MNTSFIIHSYKLLKKNEELKKESKRLEKNEELKKENKRLEKEFWKIMRRTNLTGGLIPEDTETERTLEEINSDMPKGWHLHELEHTKRFLELNNKQLGIELAQLNSDYQKCLNTMNQSISLKHHCDNLEKNQENYLDFWEENQYGKVNRVDNLDGIKDMLNKDIIIGWLSKNIDTETLTLVIQKLQNRRK